MHGIQLFGQVIECQSVLKNREYNTCTVHDYTSVSEASRTPLTKRRGAGLRRVDDGRFW
eukprot:COSAG02_NODE_1945_length_10305_cov_5.152165_11_plen_59_part_00